MNFNRIAFVQHPDISRGSVARWIWAQPKREGVVESVVETANRPSPARPGTARPSSAQPSPAQPRAVTIT